MSTAEQDHVAILVASVVGYDRLRKLNAAGAGDRLDRALRTVARIARDRGGRLFSSSDGAALEVAFSSAVDAIEVALEIQDTLAKHNAELPATDHLECGIGIAFGQAVIEGQGLGGDAALVARGLTRRARPSTTVVAKAIFRRVQPHLHFSYRRHGQYVVPGVSDPVEAYQIKKAPSNGGRSRRRRWARLTRRAAAAFTRPAHADRKWLAAAGLALALVVVGVLARIAYQPSMVEPQGPVTTAAEDTSLAKPGPAPGEAQPMTTTAEPGPAGPSVAPEPAPSPPRRPPRRPPKPAPRRPTTALRSSPRLTPGQPLRRRSGRSPGRRAWPNRRRSKLANRPPVTGNWHPTRIRRPRR